MIPNDRPLVLADPRGKTSRKRVQVVTDRVVKQQVELRWVLELDLLLQNLNGLVLLSLLVPVHSLAETLSIFELCLVSPRARADRRGGSRALNSDFLLDDGEELVVGVKFHLNAAYRRWFCVLEFFGERHTTTVPGLGVGRRRFH